MSIRQDESKSRPAKKKKVCSFICVCAFFFLSVTRKGMKLGIRSQLIVIDFLPRQPIVAIVSCCLAMANRLPILGSSKCAIPAKRETSWHMDFRWQSLVIPMATIHSGGQGEVKRHTSKGLIKNLYQFSLTHFLIRSGVLYSLSVQSSTMRG